MRPRSGEVHLESRVLGQSDLHNGGFVHGVVVHHKVQLPLGLGPCDLLQEGQELPAPVPGLARRGHMAGGDLQGREQIEVPRRM